LDAYEQGTAGRATYSYDKEVSHNAIEVYMHRLRKKIAGGGVSVRTLYGRGYVLDYESR
jgi:DNA-binding response OmpR family regulator